MGEEGEGGIPGWEGGILRIGKRRAEGSLSHEVFLQKVSALYETIGDD